MADYGEGMRHAPSTRREGSVLSRRQASTLHLISMMSLEIRDVCQEMTLREMGMVMVTMMERILAFHQMTMGMTVGKPVKIRGKGKLPRVLVLLMVMTETTPHRMTVMRNFAEE